MELGIIRKATNKDSEQISSLIFNIWINENGFEVDPDNFPDFKQIDEYYNNSDGLFLCAERDGLIVGTIATQQLDSNIYALKRMFVLKELRGTGLAQNLINELFKQKFSTLKNIDIYLSTKEDVCVAAKYFYLKNGFVQISPNTLPESFPFFYEDDLYMVKKI
jgi:N-acetylglutamate synthase-like GNAT family acetyltransferase